ncbi:uncharacterized protein LOC108674979, partial [Hyalella azteca]|uniref:Uncharacterized protein LOC108674979 n=1 Tax=Hyalella azteca TaxID=294128 RepID=A0A8B7NXG8_HYAAZ
VPHQIRAPGSLEPEEGVHGDPQVSIEEDRLVCLAQVYANIQLLGCKYPGPIFRQVQELGKGLGAQYHKKRAGKLQRTFVGAKDAAGAKARRDGTQAKARTGLRN